MKVERYFIGFGPPIWSVKKGETEYGIAALPFGGYVRIAGMNPLEEIAPEDRDRVFKAKKGWQQAIVLVAGSFTHFVVAFALAALLYGTVGVPDRPSTTIETVAKKLDNGETAPAAAAGFKAGDRVLQVNERPIEKWDDVRAIIRKSPGTPVVFLVERAGRTLTLTATPAAENPEGEKVGFLGVGPRFINKTFGFVGSMRESGRLLGAGSWESLKSLGKIVSPKTLGRLFSAVVGTEERTASDPTSIVGVSRAAGDYAGQGRFAELFFLVVAFNIFVGVANLIPLPPLDGGHLAVLAYETVRRRRVDMRKLWPVSATVVAVLVTLFVLSLYLDIVKPIQLTPG
jgi:RIP metalloprotease RseP